MFFLEKYRKPGDEVNRRQIAAIKPVFDWLTNEGVNWQAVRTAGESHLDFKNLPADYQHRPWLPQRPTLREARRQARKAAAITSDAPTGLASETRTFRSQGLTSLANDCRRFAADGERYG